MVLITDAELEAEAQLQGVGILQYTQSQQNALIENIQLILERKTGRIYDERTITEKKLSFNGRTIAVRQYPIKSITSITVDGIVETEYEVDLDNGIIYFDFPVYDMPVELIYVTDEPADIDLAKYTLACMVLDKISNRGSTVEEYLEQLKRVTLRVI